MINRKVIYAALAAAIVIIAIGAVGLWRTADARNRAYDFTLTNQDGRPFTLSQDRGHAVALFFGYTHCPDVCPATLAHLAGARRSLERRGDDIRIVFVTVDPGRDTPARMKQYLAQFDPSFVGVTGTEGELAPVYRAYHVWYQPLPKTTAGLEALEAHTATITIIDRSGHVKGYADQADSIATLAQDLRAAT